MNKMPGIIEDPFATMSYWKRWLAPRLIVSLFIIAPVFGWWCAWQIFRFLVHHA